MDIFRGTIGGQKNMSLEPYRYKDNPNNSGVSNTTTALAKILLIIGVILLLGILVDCFTPKCIYGGCDNDRREGSNYCYLHD